MFDIDWLIELNNDLIKHHIWIELYNQQSSVFES